MIQMDNIFAKSPSNGGTTLIVHIIDVARYTKIAAEYAGMDVYIANIGALLHDIGKVSPIFQERLLRHQSNPGERIFRHEIASLFFLPLFNKQDWPILIDMIIAHHKSVSGDPIGAGIIDLYDAEGDSSFLFHYSGFEDWQNTAFEIMKIAGLLDKSKQYHISEEEAHNAYNFVLNYCINKKRNWSEWKGLLVGADHFASAIENLPNTRRIPQLFRIPDISFYQRKSNLYPLSQIKSDSSRRHTFVKAPTGSGKTDFLMKRCQGRIFYVLPFQASINAMYERIKKDLNGTTDDIRLLHASSKLVLKGDNVIEEETIQDQFGSSIKILTPHQLASIVFGTKGYEELLLDIRGCDIILDEIHTYSEMMQSIVLKMIEIMNNIGCRIHIGTATMPSSLETAILNLLKIDDIQYVQLENNILTTFNRHIIHKVNELQDIWPIVDENVKCGNKVLIVSNRVSKAQEVFHTAMEMYPEIKMMLIHSRYKRLDRNILEEQLKDKFNVESGPCIVVSTQVVEVSLDINFDVMFTETAPIDSLIQRFGRINRKRNEMTIGHLKHIYVVSPPASPKDCLPYDSEIMKKSFDVLPNNEILQEIDVQCLIDTVYPEIVPMNIELESVFRNGSWTLKELRHLPKSSLLERLDIDSISCILEQDEMGYSDKTWDEKQLLEIPVRYSLMKWSHLRQLSVGSNPFVVPDNAYSETEGLIVSKLKPEFYNVDYQFI